jgi:hypothetical protein
MKSTRHHAQAPSFIRGEIIEAQEILALSGRSSRFS